MLSNNDYTNKTNTGVFYKGGRMRLRGVFWTLPKNSLYLGVFLISIMANRTYEETLFAFLISLGLHPNNSLNFFLKYFKSLKPTA